MFCNEIWFDGLSLLVLLLVLLLLLLLLLSLSCRVASEDS